MPTRPLILALGEILWDLLPDGKQVGGAPANFAHHAGELGADAHIVSAIGRDELGRELSGVLRSRNQALDTLFVVNDRPTGTVSVHVDEAGQPSYTIHENVAWDYVPTAPLLLDLAKKADCICFGSLAQRSPTTRATIRQVLQLARPQSLRIFDINLRQHYYDRDTLADSLARATVLKINDQEWPTLFKLILPDRAPAAHHLFHLHPQLKLVALTRGSDGSVLYSASGTVFEHQGHSPAQVADTVGAGDAFTAALALGLLAHRPLQQVNDHANRVASYVCEHRGATPPLAGELRRHLLNT